MFECDCGRHFKSAGGLGNHRRCCDGTGSNRDKFRGNGNILCPKCGFIIRCHFDKHFGCCDGTGPRRSKTPTEYPFNRGRHLTEEHKEKIRKSITGKGHPHTLEMRLYLSEKMKERYAGGWEVQCGRSLKYDYESPIAGIIKVDGTWELKVAQYLDSIGVSWRRNKQRFDYINLKGKRSTYCPDFWVDEWDTFLEVKGYKTDLDECKWSQFPHKLIVWSKKELKELNIL